MVKLNSLSSILEAIKTKQINYGMNKEYCFVTDEDGYIVFLKKNLDNPVQKDLDKDGEHRDQWPLNSSDGEVLWRTDTLESRGLSITEMFLDALGIEFLG